MEKEKLENKRLKVSYKVAAVSGCLQNYIADAKKLGMKSEPLERATKHFLKHLENSEDLICAKVSDVGGYQLNESYEMVESMIELNLSIEPKKVKSFLRKFKELAAKYKR